MGGVRFCDVAMIANRRHEPVTAQSQIARPIAFPVSHRTADVRKAAEVLNETHGEAAAVYWKSLVRSIADSLLAMGIPDDEVRREILEFQDCVQAELQAIG